MKQRLLAHKKEVVFGGIVVFQILTIMIFNMTQLKYMADFDSSSGMAQIAEIWKQKTLLIKGWEYQTTVGWDIPLFFAIPIYGLTKNVFFSIGIVDNLFVLGFATLIYDILKKSGVKSKNIFLTMMLFFTPYTMGQLGYVPMLFTSTASYAMKVMIPLLLVDVFVRFDTGMSWKKIWFPLACFLGFSLISAVSSGIYMLICGIAPAVLYLLIKAECRNNLKFLLCRQSMVVGLGIVMYGVGIVLAGVLKVTNSTSGMTLLTIDKLATNALGCFAGVWELFGGIRAQFAPKVLSLEGIVCLLCILITGLFLVAIGYYVVRVLKGKEKRTMVCIVLCIQLVNLCVLLLTDTTYASSSFECRYHIVSMVPSILLTGVFFHDMQYRLNVLCYRTLLAVIGIGVVIVSAFQFHAYDTQLKMSKVEQLSQITQTAKEHGAGLVYVICAEGDWTLADGRIMRVCDPEISVATIETTWTGVGWGASIQNFENANYKGKILLMIKESDTESLDAVYMPRLQDVGTVEDYKLYLAEENIIDCLTAFNAFGKKSVDFPYSTGNEMTGTITEDGMLKASAKGGVVLMGTNIAPVEGTYDMTLHYRTPKMANEGEVLGTFRLVDQNGNVIGSSPLVVGEKKAMITNFSLREDSGLIHYEVETVSESGVKIKKIVTVAKG